MYSHVYYCQLTQVHCAVLLTNICTTDFYSQFPLKLSGLHLTRLSLKTTMLSFTVMQLATPHPTSPGQKTAIKQYCIRERSSLLLTSHASSMGATSVLHGMEWDRQQLPVSPSVYFVSKLNNVYVLFIYNVVL